MNLYKKNTAKPYSYLVIDATITGEEILPSNQRQIIK